jgi:hypothetical protein
VKSTIARLCVALGATTVAVSALAAAPAPPVAVRPPTLSRWQRQQLAKFRNSAPADEYFGKLKLSFLGMNNVFRDAAISSGDHTTDPAIVNKVGYAEDALEAWGQKYPNDPQLARTYYLATQVDRKIWTKANQDRAWLYLNRVVDQFPGTYFANVIRRDLAIGFTEHYYGGGLRNPNARAESDADGRRNGHGGESDPATRAHGSADAAADTRTDRNDGRDRLACGNLRATVRACTKGEPIAYAECRGDAGRIADARAIVECETN